jgi:hypothetical protein
MYVCVSRLSGAGGLLRVSGKLKVLRRSRRDSLLCRLARRMPRSLNAARQRKDTHTYI